jgi:hypothetical protein
MSQRPTALPRGSCNITQATVNVNAFGI